MKINVIQLKKAVGSKQEFKFITSAETLFKGEEPPVWLHSKLNIYGEIVNNGRFLDVVGTIEAKADFQCTGCLEPFVEELKISFSDGFYEGDGNEFEMEYTYYNGDEVDITDLVRESILLAEPLKPICSKDCRGLCAECGINLNLETCSCTNESIDPRLSVLKQFLK